MKTTYTIDIAGLKRELTLCKLNEELQIAGFIIFGDVELTVHCAKELLKRVPDYDYILAPEAKSIPLLYEMTKQAGRNKYILARKGRKLYMKEPFEVQVRSITTDHVQTLCLDKTDADLMKGKRILILDDVVSTGESLEAVKKLAEEAGGIVVGAAFVLAEGDAAKRDDVIYLQKLPLFDKNGEPID